MNMMWRKYFALVNISFIYLYFQYFFCICECSTMREGRRKPVQITWSGQYFAFVLSCVKVFSWSTLANQNIKLLWPKYFLGGCGQVKICMQIQKSIFSPLFLTEWLILPQIKQMQMKAVYSTINGFIFISTMHIWSTEAIWRKQMLFWRIFQKYRVFIFIIDIGINVRVHFSQLKCTAWDSSIWPQGAAISLGWNARKSVKVFSLQNLVAKFLFDPLPRNACKSAKRPFSCTIMFNYLMYS